MSEPNKVIKIGLWGGERTGKTVYLAMLYHQLLADNVRWDVHIHNDKTHRFIKMAREYLLEDHKFPEKTAEHTLYVYEVHDKRHDRRFVLELMDVPGELADNYYHENLRDQPLQVRQQDGNNQSSLTPRELFNHLVTCDGILVFLDPERFERSDNETRYSYRQMLIQFLEELREYRRQHATDAPYLAFCITKVDAKKDYWHKQKDAVAANGRHAEVSNGFIAEKLTKTFMDRLPSLHPTERIGYFLISSVGRLNGDEPNVSQAVIWERLPTPRPSFLNGHNGAHADTLGHEFPPSETGYPASLRSDPQPINLTQPIEWLMDCLMPVSDTVIDPNAMTRDEEHIDNVVLDSPATPEE